VIFHCPPASRQPAQVVGVGFGVGEAEELVGDGFGLLVVRVGVGFGLLVVRVGSATFVGDAVAVVALGDVDALVVVALGVGFGDFVFGSLALTLLDGASSPSS
jgi:hypothetical protein